MTVPVTPMKHLDNHNDSSIPSAENTPRQVLSPHAECRASSYNHNTTSRNEMISLVVGIVLMLVPWIPYYNSSTKVNAFRKDISTLQDEQYRLLEDLRKTTAKVKDINDECHEIEQTNNELLKDLKIHGDDVNTHTNRYRQAEEREEALLKRIDDFHLAIQTREKEVVKEGWGEGPFRIEVTLGNVVEWNLGNSFVIETAPLKLMPHAISHFLKMVDLELWDGLTMVNRAMGTNVLQFTPLVAETAEWADERFIQANLTQMAFTEYTDEYLPHKYTVAFAGRPGGPDFYVNMDVFDEETGEDGESVFGMVVEGREVLDSIIGRAIQRKKTNTVSVESIRWVD